MSLKPIETHRKGPLKVLFPAAQLKRLGAIATRQALLKLKLKSEQEKRRKTQRGLGGLSKSVGGVQKRAPIYIKGLGIARVYLPSAFSISLSFSANYHSSLLLPVWSKPSKQENIHNLSLAVLMIDQKPDTDP